MKKVYLLWRSYLEEELIPIGVLADLENGNYSFNYFATAKEANLLGCFLPFPYTEETYYFDSLPFFFEQRILKGEFNKTKFGLKSGTHKLDCLVYGDSIRNGDNFQIISEEKYKTKAM